MKNQVFGWAVLIVLASGYSASVSAQGAWYAGTGAGGLGGYGGGWGGGYGGWGWGGWAGPQSSVSLAYSGMGNLVRSEGQYNQMTAQALVKQEEARSKYIENEQKIFNNHQAAKRVAQANDIREREADQASRARVAEYQAAHRPQPLSASELNVTTGSIQWPLELNTLDFAEFRKSLEGMFTQRAKYNTSELSARIVSKVGEMKDLLRSKIQDMPLPVYSECRKFLDRLAASAH